MKCNLLQAFLGDINEVEQLISALIKNIEKPIMINKESHSIGTSIGYAVFPRDAMDSEELLKKLMPLCTK